MNALRPGLPEVPAQMRHLPVDARGYPVPFFVAYIDGKPDFRVMDAKKYSECVRLKRCWVCGRDLSTRVAFVVGPMCAVNRTSGEPPSHRECAEFSAKACPFLTMPKMRRREAGVPENVQEPGGVMLRRNPGVALVWITKKYTMWRPSRFDGAANDGPLFDIGEPIETRWFAEGRAATREEVLASIDSGVPLLRDVAAQDPKPGALEQLDAMVQRAMRYLPAEVVP